MILWDLFVGFLKVGMFSFGGAYGAIPLIRDVVLSYGWLDDEALSYMIAVSESTPGPIMVNLATYVGSSQAGILGAAVATLATVLPSFVIILLVVTLLNAVIHNRYVKAAMRSLSACVVGVVIATGLYMTASNCLIGAIDWKSILIALILGIVIFASAKKPKFKLSAIHLIILAAVLGVLVYQDYSIFFT
jgi:chromate transporter